MNVYDTANRLSQEIRTSEEYLNYKTAKEVINLKPELKQKIEEFEKQRYETQILAMQTGKNDEEKLKKVQELYMELMENPDTKKFLEAETKFNVLIADVNKIIGETIRDVM